MFITEAHPSFCLSFVPNLKFESQSGSKGKTVAGGGELGERKQVNTMRFYTAGGEF